MKILNNLTDKPVKRALLFLIIILFATGYWLPRTWSFYGGNDWDLTYTMYEAARISVVDYHQFPQFNPWLAFGSDFNANPQSGHVSILFLPILLFGTFYGYKVSILLAMFIGASGAFRWFYKVCSDSVLSFSAAVIFILAAYFSGHIFTAGHSNTLYLYFIPWIFWGMIKLAEKYHFRYLLLVVLLLAQVIAGGAPFVYVTIAFTGGLWVLSEIWIQKNTRLILPWAAVLIAAITLNLWKLLPSVDLWAQSPRLVTDESGINVIQWFQSLGAMPFRTGTWHAHYEYMIGFPLICGGIIFYYRRHIQQPLKWLVLFGLLLWLCLGNSPDYVNPWYWLNKYVPPFNGIRAPARFGIIALFGLITAMIWVVKSEKEKKLIYIIIGSAAVTQILSFRAATSFQQDTAQVTPDSLQKLSPLNAPAVVTLKSPEQSSFAAVLQHQMIANAYEPQNLPPVYDTLDLLAPVHQLDDFTPDKIVFTGSTDTVDIGLRYSNYWNISRGARLSSHNGHIRIIGAKGSRVLAYNNPLLLLGFLWSFVTIPILILAHLLLRRK